MSTGAQALDLLALAAAPVVQSADEREAEISAFEKWQREVDAYLLRTVGMNSSDLPDYDYTGEFEMGCKPRTVARRAIRAAGEASQTTPLPSRYRPQRFLAGALKTRHLKAANFFPAVTTPA